MGKYIDLCLDLPPDINRIVNGLKMYAFQKNQQGIANYRNIFGAEKARAVGLTLEELDQLAQALSPDKFDQEIRQRAAGIATSLPDFMHEIEEAGISWGFTRAQTNEETHEIVKNYPDKLFGIAIANPHEGIKAVRSLEYAVKELGLKGFFASPYHFGLRLNDKKFYPLYAKAVELQIPVFAYCTMTYRNDFPIDIASPIYLDEVAMDFPEMTVIAGWGGGGGWPWVNEMIGVARRHSKIYINFSAHRPRYLAVPGSGWEMLLQYGNTLLQDRVVFASGWGAYFSYNRGVLTKVIKEVLELPLKEQVKEKWLYHNAANLFQKA